MAIPTAVSSTILDAHTAQVKFDQVLDRASLPDPAAFAIQSFSGLPADVIPTVVTIFGDTVYLTTPDLGPVAGGSGFPKLRYTPTGAGIKNLAGEAAAGFAAMSMAGNFSVAFATTAPSPVGAIANAAHLDIYFSETLDPANIPDPANFSIGLNGSVLTASNLAIVGTRLGMDLSSSSNGQPLLILYSPTGYPDDIAGTLRDLESPIANLVAPIAVPMIATNVGTASGYYADQTDLERFYGAENIRKWSQLDGGVVSDQTRIAIYLVHADKYIDRKLRENGYAYPLSTLSVDFDLVSDVAAELAGAWVYLARGTMDVLDKGQKALRDQMQAHEKAAIASLRSLIMRGIDGTKDFSPGFATVAPAEYPSIQSPNSFTWPYNR